MYNPVKSKWRPLNFQINDLWEMDVTYLTQKKLPKQNRNFKYMLTIVDVLSKKAHVRILRKKSGPEVAENFRRLLESVDPVRPKNLRTDRGNADGVIYSFRTIYAILL